MGGEMSADSSFRGRLLKALGKKAYDDATKSFDVMGDTAIIDAEPKVAKKFADALMESNPRISTVLRKGGAVSGEYRIRKYYYVKGSKSFLIEHRENGCVFRFDIRKVYFSPRLSFERSRVAAAAKDGENVVDMFAGVGPYSIQIAKLHKRSKVIANELNEDACGYLSQNILLNKTDNVTAILGDAKDLAGSYAKFADRIIMNLPRENARFLDAALKMARKGCVVHYYSFGSIDDPFKKELKLLRGFFSKHKRKMAVMTKRKVRNYSAKEVEIVLDFRIE